MLEPFREQDHALRTRAPRQPAPHHLTEGRQMTTTPQLATEQQPAGSLSQRASDHLWMHFTRHSTLQEGGSVPIIVRGEGPYIWDDQGKQ